MEKKNSTKKRTYRSQSVIELILLVSVVVIVNVLASKYYKKFDLTKEKRFTLSKTTEQIVEKVEDRMYFKVYLEGNNLSSKFKRLRTATLDMLTELREMSDNKIAFEFVNVFDNKTDQEKAEIIKQLSLKGINSYNDMELSADQQKRNLILPAAEVSYGSDKNYVLNLLNTEMGRAEESAINKSIEDLEYLFTNTIRKCVNKKPKRIAVLNGHGEPDVRRMDDLLASLSENYSISTEFFDLTDTNYLNQFTDLAVEAGTAKSDDDLQELLKKLVAKSLERLNEYDGIVVVKPTQALMIHEAYILDQYVMHGGKTVWMVDPIMAEHDSLRSRTKAFFPDYGNEYLRNILFNFGVRLNANLLQDQVCNDIVVSDPSRQGRMVTFPWVYYPVHVFQDNKHPIVKNLEAVWMRYPGTLKPISRKNLKTTYLLVSSPRTKTQDAPAFVDLSIIGHIRDPEYLRSFNSGTQVTGVLLEGEFQSFYKRPDKKYQFPVKEGIEKNSMIVIADGDIGLNDVNRARGERYPLGFDRETGRQFANKKFLLNCFDYLFDDNGLIDLRTKEIGLRLLDKNRIQAPKTSTDLMSEKSYWQVLNTILPVLVVILFGILNGFYRRRKYAKS